MVFHGPGDLRPEELPVRPPASGELVLRIDAALTCGTDVKTLRRGHPVMIPKIPTVFGHEFAGTVSSVGPGVSRFREGDRVVAANSAPCGDCPSCRAGRPNLCDDLLFVNGAYGEFIVLPPRLVARNVVPLAASLPAERAAFAEPLACAFLAIERARVESGQTVVVFGHGPLGCLLGMLAASRKAQVVMVGKSGWRFDRLKNLRFARWLDAATAGDVIEDIRGATGGRGADVTVDATGKPEVALRGTDAPRSLPPHARDVPAGGRGPGVGCAGAGQSDHSSHAARGGRASAGSHGEGRGPQGPDHAMTAHRGVVTCVVMLALAAVAPSALAFDSSLTFAQGTYVVSAEGSYGKQFNLEGFHDWSEIEYWNLGARVSILPFGPTGPSVLRGAIEVGLEPL